MQRQVGIPWPGYGQCGFQQQTQFQEVDKQCAFGGVQWKLDTEVHSGRNHYKLKGTMSSSGKGLYLTAALSSAFMESLERYSVMAGSGDMLPRMIEKAANMGLGTRVLFPGFTSREQSDELFRVADVFVMPSVSEPFGLVPLEAMSQGTPTIISRQSGVSEVLVNTLKTDFWDVDEIANKITAVLKYPPLGITLRNYGNFEANKEFLGKYINLLKGKRIFL